MSYFDWKDEMHGYLGLIENVVFLESSDESFSNDWLRFFKGRLSISGFFKRGFQEVWIFTLSPAASPFEAPYRDWPERSSCDLTQARSHLLVRAAGLTFSGERHFSREVYFPLLFKEVL